ncbi:MAG: hypothetical protein HQL74_07820 [Magnetococcales bacterium]|nr:hypothetical protein [Magnetococcales bacterium]
MTPTPDNPWGIRFMAMFHMSNDSGLFRTAIQLTAMGAVREGVKWQDREGTVWVPLYEAKMIHQFDHRWATYEKNGVDLRDVMPEEKTDPGYVPSPRYWVPEKEVEIRLNAKGWNRGWLMGWRDICRSTDERTVIAGVIPRVGVGNNFPIFSAGNGLNVNQLVCLVANLSSLTLDFTARHKVGGTHLNFFIGEQLPILSPGQYSQADIAFIVPRVLELTYTAHDLEPFAVDLGYHGPPFPWDPERRSHLRAELDAYYAKLYGLTRDELRYILDPADVMGPDYPSETFRVLKDKEMKAFGEYRTARLVLAAWDRLERGESLTTVAPNISTAQVFRAAHFPATDMERALCELALGIVQHTPSIRGEQHLQAMILATIPEVMPALLMGKDKDIFLHNRDTFRAFILPEGQRLGWRMILNHLERQGAIVISDRAKQHQLTPGTSFSQYPIRQSAEVIQQLVSYALKACDTLNEWKNAPATIQKKNAHIQRQFEVIRRFFDPEWREAA